MWIPDFVALTIISTTIVLFVMFWFTIAFYILTNAIEFYYKRLVRQLEITNIRQFSKEYHEWKALREQGE